MAKAFFSLLAMAGLIFLVGCGGNANNLPDPEPYMPPRQNLEQSAENETYRQADSQSNGGDPYLATQENHRELEADSGENSHESENAPAPQPQAESLNLPIVAVDRVIEGNVRIRRYLFITPEGGLGSHGIGVARDFLDSAANMRSISFMNSSRGGSIIYLTTDGTLWGFGSNSYGQLGDNTGVDRTSPIVIMENVANFGIEGQRVWALKQDRTFWVWGQHINHIDHEPVQTATDVVRFFGDACLPGIFNRSFVQTTEGRIKPSGVHHGQAEQPFIPNEPIREMVAASFASDYWLLWIDSDFTLWKRSILNINRQHFDDIHIADDIDRLYVFTDDGWRDGNIVYIVTRDNALYGVGSNTAGQLGDGTRIDRNNFVHIADDVKLVSSYAFITLNGDLWAWTGNDPSPILSGTNAVAFPHRNAVLFSDGMMASNTVYGRLRNSHNVRLPERRIYSD